MNSYVRLEDSVQDLIVVLCAFVALLGLLYVTCLAHTYMLRNVCLAELYIAQDTVTGTPVDPGTAG